MKDTMRLLKKRYPIPFDRVELMRDGGSTAYTVFSGGNKYFLRKIKPAFIKTAVTGADIQVFLQKQGFPVPPILMTNEDLPYVKNEDGLYVLYEYIEGADSDPEQDAEAIGALVGRLHSVMRAYPGELIKRDKQFYIGRYIKILQKKQYPRIDEYTAYGEALWDKIKGLPQGYCHGDMYDGNIRKAMDGRYYIHDFDTSCAGFPMYDITLICDKTKYFEFNEQNYDRSNKVLSRFMTEYKKHNSLSREEINAFHALIALQHFATQATVMEICGLDCINGKDMDNQLEWLYRWREQCEGPYKF